MTGNSVCPGTPARTKMNTSDTLLITLFLHKSICIGVWPFTWSVILRGRDYPDKTDSCIKKIIEEESTRFSVVVCIAM